MAEAWRLIVLCTTIFRLGGALFCLVGAIFIFVEADYLKYARSIKSGDGGYAWGDIGWMLFEYGAYFISFDGVISLFYSTLKRPQLQAAWPFYPAEGHPLRNSIRDGAMGFGFFFLGLGAGSTVFAYPDQAPLEYMDVWVTFYNTRHDESHLRNGAYLLILGSTLLVVSIVAIAIYCERLDVFYILPCSRCNYERQPVHESEDVVCCLHLGRPQPVGCVVQTKCTAIYQNNWMGAFFNHIYAAYVFYFIAFLVWHTSLGTATYSPFANACVLPHHNVYDNGLAHTCNHQEDDAAYYMLVSSVLLIIATALFTIHAFVYYLSIILNRPLVVNNFVDGNATVDTKSDQRSAKGGFRPPRSLNLEY